MRPRPTPTSSLRPETGITPASSKQKSAKVASITAGGVATLLGVVNHYNIYINLGLSDQEKRDLVEYLKLL